MRAGSELQKRSTINGSESPVPQISSSVR
jgi:hypothetical protein